MKTTAEARAANRAGGGHFFDRDTMRHFRSKVGRTVYGGRYFWTSEAPPGWSDAGPPNTRRYTVREIDQHGHVHTVGEFMGHATAAEAVAYIRALLGCYADNDRQVSR